MSRPEITQKQEKVILALRSGGVIECINRKFYCIGDYTCLSRREVISLDILGVITKVKPSLWTISEHGKTIRL